MKAFLVTFVCLVALNVVAVLKDRFETPLTVPHRAFAVVVDVAMAGWALYLLGRAA